MAEINEAELERAARQMMGGISGAVASVPIPEGVDGWKLAISALGAVFMMVCNEAGIAPLQALGAITSAANAVTDEAAYAPSSTTVH